VGVNKGPRRRAVRRAAAAGERMTGGARSSELEAGCRGDEGGWGRERERKGRGVRESDIIIKGQRGRTRGVVGVDAGTGARALPWRPDVRERHVAEQERRRFVGWCCWREHRIRCRAWDGLFGCLDLAGHI